MEIKCISADDTLELRQKVLWPESSQAACKLENDYDGVHFGAFIAQRLIAIVSIFIVDDQAQLRKFAVDFSYQSQGIGIQLVTHIESYLMQLKVSAIWCDARENAVGFYKKSGFIISPNSFVKKGLTYYKACKKLH